METEYIDIYDADGNKTGKIVDRSVPLGEGEYFLATGTWVLNTKGQLFVTRRSPEKRYMPGRWEVTAGHARAGEDGVDSAIRELYEETGIKANRDELVCLSRRRDPRLFAEDYALVRDFDLKDVVLQEGETCDCGFVSWEEWEDMIARGIVSDYVVFSLGFFRETLMNMVRDLKGEH